MAWQDVPAKMTEYRAIEYGGDANADKLLAAYFGWRNLPGGGREYSEEYVPERLRPDFEVALDYRLGACRNLVKSRGWSGEKLRQV